MDWHLEVRESQVRWYTDIDIGALFDLYHGTVDFEYDIINFFPK